MYKKSAKTWKVIGIISIILAVGGCIVCAMNAASLGVTGGELIMLVVLGPILMGLGFSSLAVNLKKILLGLVAPIPVISMLIEYFKGMFMAIKGYIWMFKNPKGEAME